jgi:hypothetical protein
MKRRAQIMILRAATAVLVGLTKCVRRAQGY